MSRAAGEGRSARAILTAAYLKTKGRNEEEIARILKVNQSTVSRYLTAARKEHKWLTHALDLEVVPVELLNEVKGQLERADVLQKKVDGWANAEVGVEVFYSGTEDLDSENGYRRR